MTMMFITKNVNTETRENRMRKGRLPQTNLKKCPRRINITKKINVSVAILKIREIHEIPGRREVTKKTGY